MLTAAVQIVARMVVAGVIGVDCCSRSRCQSAGDYGSGVDCGSRSRCQ